MLIVSTGTIIKAITSASFADEDTRFALVSVGFRALDGSSRRRESLEGAVALLVEQ